MIHPGRVSGIEPAVSLGEGMQSVVRVQCSAAWDSVRELNDYLARYVSRMLAATPATRARVVISELLDTAAGAARASSAIDYELLMRAGDFSEFATSISMNMVEERARLLGSRVHKLNQLEAREACRTILVAVAHGKEDETVLPLARIRSEGMRLAYAQTENHVKITALTR